MKKIIYGILMLMVVVITGILIIKLNIKEDKPDEECRSITGGGYEVIFNTNSNIKLNNIHVCIACPPNTYVELPSLEQSGYLFDGWYYDEELTKKVEAPTTLDITPNPIYKEENCITGYNDITLYAKWTKTN